MKRYLKRRSASGYSDRILAAYPDEIAGAKFDATGKPDVGTVVAAIRKIKARVPALFKEQDFSKMDDATYSEAEKRFREKLSRNARPAERNWTIATWMLRFSAMKSPARSGGTLAVPVTASTKVC